MEACCFDLPYNFLILVFLQTVLPKFFVPPSFTTIDIGQKVVITEGDSLFIRAHLLQGTPDPIVSWTLPDGSILNVKERHGHIFVKRNGTLEVKRIQSDDKGRYTATATNRVGNVTAVSLVTVVIQGKCPPD